MEVIATPET